MSMLLFMPWCSIDQEYQLGDIAIVPFERGAAVADLNEEQCCQVDTILASYKTIQGEPIPRCALIRHSTKSIIDDLADGEINIAYDLVTLACFASLAARDYFNPIGVYCNAECFAMYVQKFGAADFTALTTRRRDGGLLNAWPIDSIAITVPPHCQPIREVRIDAELLAALVAHRTVCGDAVLGRWQNALSCFNQANTDSDTFRYQTEWVLLCSAFEHLLDARPKAVDVGTRFSRALVPGNETLARNARRRRPNWNDGDRPVRDEWMREFYRVRGDFAHGQLNTRQPMSWTASEHLLLASIAFPLLVRALLTDHGVYQFSREDQVQSNAFESLADTPDFLNVQADQQGGLNSKWKRLQQRELCGLRVAAAARALKNLSETTSL